MGLRVAELFAGVGGFRLGLQSAGHEVVWSNQWEPATKAQHASKCYVRWFGTEGHSNQDIHEVETADIPAHDLLVGGFPCQDYSVAATLDKSRGIEGKKGILWWQIDRILRDKRPAYLLLENVDRLLKSPSAQRGRDFAIVLSCLATLGYRVEWRVLNAADYGFPHRRRRVFLFGAHATSPLGVAMNREGQRGDYLLRHGFFAPAFPVAEPLVEIQTQSVPDTAIEGPLENLSKRYAFEFQNSGLMVDGKVWTRRLTPKATLYQTLGSVLEQGVPEPYYVPEDLLKRWKYLKGPKNEERIARSGYRYNYTEGAIPFPDRTDLPSRTILTGEGGVSPSRSNHLIQDPWNGRFRTLTPVECERLNGFPDNWTLGMPTRWRYFTMGNALVVGLVERMGRRLQDWLAEAGQTPRAVAPAVPVAKRRAGRRRPSKP